MPGTGKKMLMWLGLADAEEYDDYEAYDDAPAPAPQVATARRGNEVLETVPAASPAVRTLPRDGHEPGAPSICVLLRPHFVLSRLRPRPRGSTWPPPLSSPMPRRSQTVSAPGSR